MVRIAIRDRGPRAAADTLPGGQGRPRVTSPCARATSIEAPSDHALTGLGGKGQKVAVKDLCEPCSGESHTRLDGWKLKTVQWQP